MSQLLTFSSITFPEIWTNDEGSDIFAEWNKQIIFADKENVLIFRRTYLQVVNSNRLFIQTIYRNAFYTVFDPLSEVKTQRFNPRNLV